MKGKKTILLVYILVLATIIIACNKKEEVKFTVGKWNGNIYENTWLNMKFKITDDWSIVSDEELAKLAGMAVDELTSLKESDKESKDLAAKMKNLYCFMVSKNDKMNVLLAIENQTIKQDETKFDEETYLDNTLEVFNQYDNISCEELDRTTKEIAGKKFHVLKISLNDDAMLEDIYTYKLNDYLVVLVACYSPAESDEMNQFMSDISKIK
jgi:uncharacterized lipoprotein YehR (DUF1307 family)